MSARGRPRHRRAWMTAAVRDLSHIRNRPPGIVSAQTSRGDTNMRKFILIAGFVLASAAAQAGDRSLSLGGIETQAAPAPAKAMDASKSAQAAEAPKYVERPAVVEPKPETSKAETSQARDGKPERPRRPGCSGTLLGPRAPDPEDRRPGELRNVEERGAAPHALRDPGAHHQRTAPRTASTGKLPARPCVMPGQSVEARLSSLVARHLTDSASMIADWIGRFITAKQNAPWFKSEERVFIERLEPANGFPPILIAKPSAPRC